MDVAEMLTCLAFMLAAVRIGEPLGAIFGVSVMRLMETRFINSLRRALHAYEEHCNDHKLENRATHSHSLQKTGRHVQK